MAANVIDALLVTLGLDASKFKAGAKEVDASLAKTSGATSKTSKDMEAWGKSASIGISKLRNEVLGLLAVFTAGVGIKNFATNTIGATAGLGRMATNLDMSAKNLAMWQLANKNAGGSLEGMTSQLQEAQKAVSDYALGRENAANKAFQTTGFSKPEDFKDAETLLRARSDAVAKIIASHGITVGRSLAADMGINDDTFQLLKQGADQVDRLRIAQAKLADEQAKAAAPAEELRKKWDDLTNKIEAISVKILTSLMPQLMRLTDWVSSHQADIEVWANRAVSGIEKFVRWADRAAESVGGWKNVLVGLIALNILSVVAPLLALAAAFVKLGAGMTVVGGSAGASAIGALGKLAKIGGVGAALGLYSGGLNTGEDEDLARRRALGSEFDKGPKPKPQSGDKFGALESKYGLPSGLLDAVWKQESGRGKNMLSPAGAQGHFQFMPATAKQYGLQDPNNLEESSDAAARMYRDLLRQNNGDLPRALAGYNWGQGNLSRKGMDAAPKETRDYIDQIQRQMAGGGGSPMNAINTANASRAGSRTAGMASNTTTSETNINGPINIYTQATDANGIARDMRPALNRYTYAGQANTGLN